MQILDCTIRDGGYYTNWDFDTELVTRYLTDINKLPVDVLEIGYVSPDFQIYRGEYYYLNEVTLRMIRSLNGKRLAVLINVKEFEDVDIKTFFSRLQGTIHLIRLATTPSNLSTSLAISASLRELGFETALNLMYASEWQKDSTFIQKFVSQSHCYDYCYVVDSYGSLTPDEVSLLISKIKQSLPGSTKVGFHGHDNMELALANSIEAIQSGADIVDGTVLGMGRGAGNLKTELLILYLIKTKRLQANLASLASLTSLFEPLKLEKRWGSNFPYSVSGAFGLKQAEIMHLFSLRRFTTNELVGNLTNKISTTTHSIPVATPFQRGNHLLVGGGRSYKNLFHQIQEWIYANDIDTVIYMSLPKKILSGSHKTFVVTNGYRWISDETVNYLADVDLPMGLDDKFPTKKLQLVSCDLYGDSISNDAPLKLGLSMLNNDCCAYLCGFDGYAERDAAGEENQSIIRQTKHIKKMYSLTDTLYQNLEIKSLYV